MLKITVRMTAEEAAGMVGMPVSTLLRWRKTKPKLYDAVMKWCLTVRFEGERK